MIEILRQNGYYYIVFERPSSLSLGLQDPVEKMPLNTFIPIFSDFVENYKSILEITPNAYIRP